MTGKNFYRPQDLESLANKNSYYDSADETIGVKYNLLSKKWITKWRYPL